MLGELMINNKLFITIMYRCSRLDEQRYRCREVYLRHFRELSCLTVDRVRGHSVHILVSNRKERTTRRQREVSWTCNGDNGQQKLTIISFTNIVYC